MGRNNRNTGAATAHTNPHQSAPIRTDFPATPEAHGSPSVGVVTEAPPTESSPGDSLPAGVESDAIDDSIMIEVPIVGINDGTGHASRSLRQLSFRHAATLRDVAQALIRDGFQLSGGKPIQSNDDALAWMLERIEAGRKTA